MDLHNFEHISIKRHLKLFFFALGMAAGALLTMIIDRI